MTTVRKLQPSVSKKMPGNYPITPKPATAPQEALPYGKRAQCSCPLAHVQSITGATSIVQMSRY